MKKTGQDLKVEIESGKNTQSGLKLEMKNLGTQTETSEAHLTSRTQDIGERISGIEDMVEETENPVKENDK